MHGTCPARRRQVVLSATEYPAVVRMLERQRPRVGGRNEKVTVVFSALRSLRNRFPALTRSEDVRDMSKLVKTPPTQVNDAAGVNAFSIVLFRVTVPGEAKPGCSFTDSDRRYPNRALMLVNIRPISWREGETVQLIEPFGQSTARVLICTCSSARSVQTTPRVNRYVTLARSPSGTMSAPPADSVRFFVVAVSSNTTNMRKPPNPPSAS